MLTLVFLALHTHARAQTLTHCYTSSHIFESHAAHKMLSKNIQIIEIYRLLSHRINFNLFVDIIFILMKYRELNIRICMVCPLSKSQENSLYVQMARSMCVVCRIYILCVFECWNCVCIADTMGNYMHIIWLKLVEFRVHREQANGMDVYYTVCMVLCYVCRLFCICG